jgi:hypothetical protein
MMASLSWDWGPGRGDGSNLERMDRKRVMWERRVVNSCGWEERMERAWEEVVASSAGREAEKTDADELIRWWSA